LAEQPRLLDEASSDPVMLLLVPVHD